MATKTTLFTVASLLVASSAAGQVNLGVEITTLGGFSTATSFPAVIWIDKNNSGLTDLVGWDGSSFLPDPDDVLLSGNHLTNDGDGSFENAGFIPAPLKPGTLDIDPTLLPGVQSTAANLLDDANVLGGGDDVYLLWFPETATNAAAPGAGTTFGALFLYELPDAFGTTAPQIFASPQGSTFSADYVTAPEPTSLALLGLGGLLVARRRRG